MNSYTDTTGILPPQTGHKRSFSQLNDFSDPSWVAQSSFVDFPQFEFPSFLDSSTFSTAQNQSIFGQTDPTYEINSLNFFPPGPVWEPDQKRPRLLHEPEPSFEMDCFPFLNRSSILHGHVENEFDQISDQVDNGIFTSVPQRPNMIAHVFHQAAICNPCGGIRQSSRYAGYQPAPMVEAPPVMDSGYVCEKPLTLPISVENVSEMSNVAALIPEPAMNLDTSLETDGVFGADFLSGPMTMTSQSGALMAPHMPAPDFFVNELTPSFMDTSLPASVPLLDFASSAFEACVAQTPSVPPPMIPSVDVIPQSRPQSNHDGLIDLGNHGQLMTRFDFQPQVSHGNEELTFHPPTDGIFDGTVEINFMLPGCIGGKPQVTKRGPFKNTTSRRETAKTRVLGSCVRCRMQRIRCKFDPDNLAAPCLTCQKAQPNTKIWRLPCLRYKIPDVQLFKPSNGVKGLEWTKRWSNKVDNIATWQSTEVRTIRVSEGYTSGYVELKVREFRPLEGDKLIRTWVAGGQKKEVLIPAFAICDISAAQKEYRKYIDGGIRECINSILQQNDHGQADPMLYDAYNLAFQMRSAPQVSMDERIILDKTLQLWMSIRLTTKSTIIIGDETLGMPKDIMDHTSPLHNKIPLPPVMGAQIDLILIEDVQKKLRRELLEKLQKMTQANSKKTWLTLYLVTFILLHNISMITAHDAGYAKKHGLNRRFAREEKVREYHLGANILLAYFHYCNKGLNPFGTSCSDQELRSLAELDDEKLAFIHRTRSFVSEKHTVWDKVRNTRDYENDFYFISQMFQKGWTPVNSP